MKKQLRFFLYIAVALLVVNCSKLLPPTSTELIPAPLELHGAKISYQIKAVLPPKSLPKNKTYVMKAYYTYGSEEQQVGEASFEGVKYAAKNKKEPTNVSLEGSFDYQEAMKRGSLSLAISSVSEEGKVKELPERISIGAGTITTSDLVLPVYQPAYVFHGYNDQEELLSNRFDFYYEKGEPSLSNKELRSEGVKNLGLFIATRLEARSVNFTGMHSPEGPEAINASLAPARAASAKKLYDKQLKRYAYKEDSVDFTESAVTRDWTPFRSLLRENQDIAPEAREKILAIINGGGTFEDKQLALEKMPVYQKIYKDLYPSLRSSQLVVMTVKPKYTPAQIIAYSTEIGKGAMSADSLSYEELLYGASKTPILKEKEAIYRATEKKDESKAAANTNLGSVLLSMAADETNTERRNKLIEAAVIQLEAATKKAGLNAETLTNLAISYLLSGNSMRAYDALQQGKQKSPSPETAERLNAILGTIQVERGEYDAALASLAQATPSPVVEFNKALAYVLKGAYKEAENSIISAAQKYDEDATPPKMVGRFYYLVAITVARQGGKEDYLLEMLKKAIEKDSSLKGRAVTDLEFRGYADIITQL